MLSFIATITVITAILLWLLVRPLLKTRDSISYERQAQNIHYAQERLAELEEQLKNATISATDYEALKLEIEQTLAEDIDLQKKLQEAPTSSAQPSSRQLIILFCTLLPLCAIAIYFLIGTPTAVKPNGLTQAIPEITPDNIDQVLNQIQQRLDKNPDDIAALNSLANIQYAMGRYQDAIKVNQHLIELQGENADLLSRLADLTALSNQGNLSGQAGNYIQGALEINPRHPQALWLAGLAALQQGNTTAARQHWNTLLPLIAGTPQEQELKQIIQRTLNNDSPLTNNTSNEQKGEQETTGKSLTVQVSVDESLLSQTNKNDLIFVFAKAVQGPPAPLAVKRLRVADLPTTVSLTENDAMMPQLTIAQFEDLLISARISKSGNPIAQSGDLQSDSISTVNTDSDPINIVINQIVK